MGITPVGVSYGRGENGSTITLAGHTGGQAGDTQLVFWTSHASLGPPTITGFTIISNTNSVHSRLVIYKRIADATNATQSVSVTSAALHGANYRSYRGVGSVVISDSGLGLVSPSRAVTGRLIRAIADSESNAAVFPPTKILTPPSGLINATDSGTLSYTWYEGLLTGDDPTASGSVAPSRTATQSPSGGLYPQWVDVMLLENGAVKFGTSALSAMKFGASAVAKAFVGTSLIYAQDPKIDERAVVDAITGKLFWYSAADLANNTSDWVDRVKGATATRVVSTNRLTLSTASTPLGSKSIGGAANSGYDEFHIKNPYDLSPLKSVTANREGGAGEQAWNASTGLDFGWYATDPASAGAAILTYELTTANVVTGYSITPRTSWENRAPNTWTFEGSNNGSSWTTLDTRSGQIQSGWTGGVARAFSFTNSTAYRYYRINVTAANGGGLPGVQIQYLLLTGPSSFAAPSFATSAEAWIVVKSNDTSANAFPFRMSADGSANHYLYSGTMYVGFASNGRAGWNPVSYTATNWNILRLKQNGTTLTAWVNGIQQAAPMSTTFTRTAFARLLDGKDDGSFQFNGSIAEILVLGRNATDAEVSKIENYLRHLHLATT